ncbi:MAG: hypothetical protein L0Y64_14035 [Myxococcaceae bacterium]|nr:hypothetical protein [Myxococcaceae bacterium]
MRSLSRWERDLLLVGVVLLAGCRPAVTRTEEATDVVRRFFAALPEGNCDQLAPLLVTGADAQPCAAVVAELNRHAVRLLEVESAQEDGRNPDAILVRARLAQGGVPRANASILRVERQGSTWRLRP